MERNVIFYNIIDGYYINLYQPTSVGSSTTTIQKKYIQDNAKANDHLQFAIVRLLIFIDIR